MNLQKITTGALGLLLLVSCGKKAQDTSVTKSAKTYPVTELVAKDVELHSVFPTVLKGQVTIEIKPRVEGFIEKVYVDEGAEVKKGMPLFKINSPSSVQALKTARAQYNTAELDVERMRPLAEKGIISDVLLKSYENAFQTAKANLDNEKASMGWTTVTSPINGTVGTITFRIGSLVNSSSVLTDVANTNKVVAYFSMNEKELLEYMRKWEGDTQAEKIKNMPSVNLILADGSQYEEEGRIETISGVVDPATGAVNFRAVFNNPHGLLRSGTSGKIIIPTELKDVFVIPQKATFARQNKILVYTLEGDKTAEKVITAASTPDGKSYAVLDGLEAGQRIVTDGISTLKNGMKIQIQ